MSTLKVNAIQNTSGVEQYLAKAWVNFNGTGTVAIRGSGGVSSISDNGVGDYTVNLTNALADTNYAAVVTASFDGVNGNYAYNADVTAQTTTTLRVRTGFNTGSVTAADVAVVNVSIFR